MNTISPLCCVERSGTVQSVWTPGRHWPYCAGLGEEISWEAGGMPSFSYISTIFVYFTLPRLSLC